jgi:methyl-accepting chemotaxis protein
MNLSFRSRSFGEQIAQSLAGIAMLAVAANIVGIFALRTVVDSKDRVVDVNAQMLIDIEAARVQRERRAKAVRSFVIAPRESFVEDMGDAQDSLLERLDDLRARATSDDERRLIDRVARANDVMHRAWLGLVELKRSGATMEDIAAYFARHSSTSVRTLDEAFVALSDFERARLAQATAQSTADASRAISALTASAIITTILTILAATYLSRALRRRIGAAVHGVQSSSTELEAAAHQQVSSTQELTTTTSEITVTIRELLATSRQIAESAQRVVSIADQTRTSSRTGDQTVQRTQEAIGRIKGQVDQIVNRMVDLGRKSQQIGSILELINELAEQTNILSINASIEAAGAGETGKRFAVVADEIRRLADHVGGSAREIRTLIDEIRAAANATVMATEDGSKSVDAGAKQFAEVLATFKGITDQVTLTNEAAREIELSTRQQTAAVEQLNVAIGGVSQAAKETQSSSSQTLATCSELADVSRQLSALIQAGERLQASREAA